MKLAGKVIIVTGASSGIGAAAARLFAREGASLVLGARRAALLEQVLGDIKAEGGSGVILAGDVREEPYARALVDMAKSSFGGLDTAFNNAGILGELSPVGTLSLESWNETIQTNLTAGFLGAKYQIPAMLERGGGSVIFTSSFVGNGMGLPGMSAYAAAKAGLVGLAQCLAVEYGAQNIRVNALLPGGTRTAMAGDFDSSSTVLDDVAKLHALGRIAEPEEIARAALFLAGDGSSFVTGSALYADGGNSICKGG